MLDLPHMTALKAFAQSLRRRDGVEVPEFDPMDGGTEARALFLFEKPGPMTSTLSNDRKSGSGFISRDNDDPTAEAIFKFMQLAGIDRKATLIWNVVPWWNGTRKITRQELQDGLSSLRDLLLLLPKIGIVVLVGKKAARAEKYLVEKNYKVSCSTHPSPIVRARWPERWHAIAGEWEDAARLISAP